MSLKEEILQLFGAHLVSAEWDCPPEEVATQILETISKHLPEKRPRFGPQNENGDYAPEEYENGGYNEAIDQVNKLLTTNKRGKV